MWFVYLLILFILEGVGLSINFRYLILLIPAIFAFEKWFTNKLSMALKIDKKALFVFFLFLLSIFFSVFLSVDKINSFLYFFIYIVYLILFLLGAYYQKTIEKKFVKLVLFLSFVFTFTSLFINFKIIKTPTTPTQLTFSFYQNHNHLGDFLGLIIIAGLINLIFNKKKYFFISLFFLPFFLLSFSRTAYLSLLSTIFLFLITTKREQPKKIIYSLFILLFLFLLISSRSIYSLPFINKFLPVVNQRLLSPRDFLNPRLDYYYQAIIGFLEKPLFGWGPNNFFYISHINFINYPNIVYSSLSYPLTILSEIGIFGFIFFVILITLTIINVYRNHFNNKESLIIFFSFIYLLLNFNTDYLYENTTLLGLFFLIAGTINKKSNSSIDFYPLNLFISIVNLILISLFLASQIMFLKNKKILAINFYPLNHQNFEIVVNELIEQNQKEKAKKIIDLYHLISPISYNFFNTVLTYNEKVDSLIYLDHLENNLLINNFPLFDFVRRVYKIKKKYYGKNEAVSFFKKVNKKYTKIIRSSHFDLFAFKINLAQFCQKENISGCRYTYLYIPKPNSVEKSEVSRYQSAYHFNNLSSHNQINYSIKKPKNVFRIIVLGDAYAFGFLVNTKDSWPERLANLLNQEINQDPNRKIEIINLSYHNYDLLYQVERYLIDGKKLEPDLIIWMNNNFYRLHEYFAPILEKYYYYDQEPTKAEYQKKGVYFPSWHFASEEYYKQINEGEIFQKEKEAFEEFFENYRKPVILVTLEQIPQEIKKTLLSSSQITIYELNEIKDDKNNFYPQIGSLNPQGHQKIAEFLKEVILNYFK